MNACAASSRCWPWQHPGRADQAHEGDLDLRQRLIVCVCAFGALELQVADFADREGQRQLRTEAQRVVMRPGFRVDTSRSAVVQAQQPYQLKKFEPVGLGTRLVDQTSG